jgi:hypothetical protein
MWDKPKQTRERGDDEYMFDGGPRGGYVPNMSDADAAKWKGKLVGTTTSSPQVELRKTFSRICGNWGNSASVLIIVSLGDGYKYKNHLDRDNTKGINIHMSTNNALQMTFDEMSELNAVVEEAKQHLISVSNLHK